jgi:outer membrane protein assembly factor BamB
MRNAFVFVCALIVGCGGFAADWPQFRGPTAQGLYDGTPLPTEWGKSQNIAWRKPVAGLGWSSPVIAGGRVYLTTAVPDGHNQSLRAICLDAAKGSVIWDKQVFHQDGRTAPPIQAKNSHASPTPLVRDGKLYIHFGHQGTACLDLDGKILWQNRELKYPPVHGNGGSPELVDDVLIFSCDGSSEPFVAGLEAGTGKVRWKTPRTWDSFKKFAFCTPLVIEVNGKKQAVIPGAGGVAAYDPADGKEIWKVLYDGYSNVPRPVFENGVVYVSTGYDSASLLAIRADGKGDVTESNVAWKLRRAVPRNASPLLVNDELYLVSDDGQASCVDAKTGKVHWQERIPGAYSASPLYANGLIYCFNERGLTMVLKASKTFEIVSKNDLGERALASPAAADGALYLRTEKALYRIGK